MFYPVRLVFLISIQITILNNGCPKIYSDKNVRDKRVLNDYKPERKQIRAEKKE